MHVSLSGNYFKQQREIIPNNNNVINIYCVYELQPIASSRYDTFAIQNALFGAMEITKNADTSKYNYKGYGLCFEVNLLTCEKRAILIILHRLETY